MTEKKKYKPWDYVNSINHKEYIEDLSGFSSYLTAMMYSAGTLPYCYVANVLNKLGQHILPKRMIYDFYFYGIPENKKFFKYPKKETALKDIKYLQQWFNYDEKSAKTAYKVINKEEMNKIREFYEETGVIK